MKIELVNNNPEILELNLEGRLDTITSPEFEAVVEKELPGKFKMELDFTNLEYISSAGLRVLLSAKKMMGPRGQITIKNANEYIQDTFEITGFSDLLDIV